MTLNQIFDTIQYGEEYTKTKALKEDITSKYDKDLDIFYASKRIKELSNKTVLSELEEQKIDRLISKLIVIEDRLEDGKPMSEAYRKMQASIILENCDNLAEEVTKSKKADLRKVETFAKMVAATKYFVENSLDTKAVLKENTNPVYTKHFSEEKKAIENILN